MKKSRAKARRGNTAYPDRGLLVTIPLSEYRELVKASAIAEDVLGKMENRNAELLLENAKLRTSKDRSREFIPVSMTAAGGYDGGD